MNAELATNYRKVQISFNWKDSLSIQRILDVVSYILAKEYILMAKQNPEIFQNQRGVK
jgi:hypothetical protein